MADAALGEGGVLVDPGPYTSSEGTCDALDLLKGEEEDNFLFLAERANNSSADNISASAKTAIFRFVHSETKPVTRSSGPPPMIELTV